MGGSPFVSAIFAFELLVNFGTEYAKEKNGACSIDGANVDDVG